MKIKEIISHIEGFLFDLNGVFYVGDQLIEGAVETIQAVKAKQIPCRFTTNTTTKSLDTLHEKLTALGLPIPKSEIISAPYAAVLYLRQLGSPKCYLMLRDVVKRDFAEFPLSETEPEVIVIGDIGDRWNYQTMNAAFKMLIQGSELVALHKGKYWQTETGLQLDIGAFIAGLEYATGKRATVIGKPSTSFFELALQDLGLPADKVAMVGDDIDNDIGGAQKAGLTGILVKTGKYRQEFVQSSSVKPDLILDSIAVVGEFLEAIEKNHS